MVRTILAAAFVFGACGGGEQNGRTIPEGDFALVVTTDYQTGSYAAIQLADHAVIPDIEVIHPDAVCRTNPFTGRPYLVSRMGADAVEVLDVATGLSVEREYSVEAGSNPQDIAFASPDRAWIPRHAEPDLLAVDPEEGTVLDRIDLSPWADGDGIPEAAWSLALEGKVYVALQRLDNFEPTDYSSVVVLDGASGEVETEIRLGATNPFARMRYSAGMGRIVVGTFGRLGEFDGGVEFIDPSDMTSSGLVVTEEVLGGDLADVVVLDRNRGYAVVSRGNPDGSQSTSLVRFDPSTGAKVADLIVADGFDHSFLELSPDGTELWVTERIRTGPGIRIFDTADDTEITTAPIDVGLPPFMVCFVPGL